MRQLCEPGMYGRELTLQVGSTACAVVCDRRAVSPCAKFIASTGIFS